MKNEKEVKKEEKKVVDTKTEDAVLDAQVAAVLDSVKSDGVTEFSVYDEGGKFVRTYSVEIHGKEAKQLARQFATKIKGTIKNV